MFFLHFHALYGVHFLGVLGELNKVLHLYLVKRRGTLCVMCRQSLNRGIVIAVFPVNYVCKLCGAFRVCLTRGKAFSLFSLQNYKATEIKFSENGDRYCGKSVCGIKRVWIKYLSLSKEILEQKHESVMQSFHGFSQWLKKKKKTLHYTRLTFGGNRGTLMCGKTLNVPGLMRSIANNY